MSIYRALMIIIGVFIVSSCESKKPEDISQQRDNKKEIVSHRVPNKISSKDIDTLLLEKIIENSEFYSTTNQKDSIFKYDSLLKNLATKANLVSYRAKGESYLAYDFREVEKYDSAFYYYNKAKNTYKILKDSTQVGKKLIEMGKIQYRQADYYGSKESITEALEYLHSEEDASYWPVAMNELGNNYFALKDYKNAEKSYEKAIYYEENLHNKILYKNNMANVYAENNQEEKAIEILETVLNDLPSDFDTIEYARLVHNLAVARWKWGTTDVYQDFQKALQIRKAHNDQWGLLSSYTSLLYYYGDIDPKLAIQYADSVIQISKKTHTPNSEKEALAALLKLQPQNQKTKDRYIFISDSLTENELKVKNQYAFFRYQNQLEKDQILTLQAQSAKRKAELAEQKNQKIIFLGVIGLLLMITIFIIYYLKQSSHKQRIQERHSTEKRISQQLHDELANDVFGLMMKIENKESSNNIEHLKQLENIYSRVRNISHENNPIHSSDEFLEDLKNLINSYNSNDVKIITKGLEDIHWNRLEEEKCIVIYRTVNELLVNMKKHSQASLVGLQFLYHKKNIRLSYKDNGIGFPEDIIFGFGLNNTVSRIHNNKGTFNFTSKQGRGISVEVLVPAKF